ncbi:uncharacterized protein LOC112505210 [Cynara cardunculus var. scolymus]|uniref:uncharacterized protein LOC112505210 n=1 Tax=Cynara cardunculus var. scolymus TaxID=59895 RepID=UPI000D62F0AF|nr:uncharacterized protein LOC112505210 [Cynara cardunculus var. scolymus]
MYQSRQSSQSHAPRQQNASESNGSLESLLKGFINQTNATLRNLETQLGQFAADLKNRPQGTLPSDTETSKEHVKVVTLRNDENLRESSNAKETSNELICQENIPHSFDTSKFPVLFPPAEVTQNPVLVQKTAALSSSSTNQSPADTAHSRQKVPTPQQKKTGPTDIDLRDLPFPGKMKAKNADVQFKKFLDIFKKLHINIPLVEALEQMPSYVKFLKDILSKKRSLSEFETVYLTKKYSVLLTCKIPPPPKLKDMGSFTIPCSIGGKEVGHALCDLGASINLMPLSIFNKLGIREIRPTTVILQLADRSLAYPKGKIEDILVKVDKFIFLANLLVLDYEADRNVPIILGRPFLATGRTLIDVQKGELTMRVNDQYVTFNVFKSLKFNGEIEECSSIYSVGEDLDLSLIDCVRSGDTVGIAEHICEEDLLEDIAAFKQLDFKDRPTQTPSIVEAPNLELKPLFSHLKYPYLMKGEKLPVIISSNLSGEQEERLIDLLKDHKKTFGWTIADIGE